MREYIVEYLGAVFFFYVCVITSNALAIGAALALALYVSQSISSGGFNPAFTLVKWLKGSIPVSAVPGYLIAQLAAVVTVYQIYKRLKK
jgi:glycerol uptake facilitator-like aquaporin